MAWLEKINGVYRVCYRDGSGRRQRITLACLMATKASVRGGRRYTPAADFGPLVLRAVRQTMIDLGRYRNYVNVQANRVRQILKWGGIR